MHFRGVRMQHAANQSPGHWCPPCRLIALKVNICPPNEGIAGYYSCSSLISRAFPDLRPSRTEIVSIIQYTIVEAILERIA